MTFEDRVRSFRRAMIAAAPIAGLVALAALWPASASAQLARMGNSVGLHASGTMRGSDVAYDPLHDVHLVVEGNGQLFGIFTDASGTATSLIAISAPSAFTAFPRVEYGPDLDGGNGGFLVTWLQAASPNQVHSVVIATSTRGVISGDQVISDGSDGGCWFEAGAPIAYSTTSHRFMVAWQTARFSIRGAVLDSNGGLISRTQFANVDSSRDPGLAWNPWTDEFGLSYSAFDAGAYVVFRKVRPDGSLSTPKYGFGFNASGSFNTDLAVNPMTGNYVLAYASPVGSVIAANVAEFDLNATEIGHGVLSGQIGGADNLAIAFNPTSQTFLAVGQTSSGSWDISGVELNARGVPLTTAQILTNGALSPGSLYPRVDRSNTNRWNIGYVRQFVQTMDQIIATGTTNGGSTATLVSGSTAPSTSLPTTTTGCSTPDPFAAMGGGTCVNGGWLPPSSTSTSTSTSGGCTGTAPFAGAVCVNGGWVPGSSTTGGSTSGCPGTQPFAGAVCVNGGWVPGTSTTGGSTSGCPGTQPFAGAVCVNGGWVPGTSTTSGSTSGCPGTQPFAGAVCVNGGWVPGTSTTSTSTSSCPGTAPFAGAVCVNGGWVPGTGSTGSTTCTTPDPFASTGGGVCINGGWVPVSMVGGKP